MTIERIASFVRRRWRLRLSLVVALLVGAVETRTDAQPGASSAPAGPSSPAPPAHRHRLIGVAAKSAMMHASVLYHESAPEKTLDRDMARQNAAEIVRLAVSQRDNLAVLEQDPTGNEPASHETVAMATLVAQVRVEAESLLAELKAPADARALPGASDATGGRARRLFHLEKRVLQLHQTAEAILGIQPPKDPPE